ncbi:hypothetical protein TEA_023237 [Camellia sinensis var. sinensis]|uniref:PDZ domain-containing protein n=1 Tax=Camellia sinensis var. sinensis TaxID=542762 RepID=A0A4S4DMG4_CAMSN|nr:hypothetical protein TEA_023237 [Camellia sinensis var. sinensis]
MTRPAHPKLSLSPVATVGAECSKFSCTLLQSLIQLQQSEMYDQWRGSEGLRCHRRRQRSWFIFCEPLAGVDGGFNWLRSGGRPRRGCRPPVKRKILRFDETRRLGLRSETEQIVRHASLSGETGMLVVDTVVPGGPAHNLLEPGDVLVRINGDVTTQFLKMETLLDDSVDQKITLLIERGGTPLTVDLVSAIIVSIDVISCCGR